MGWRTVAVTNQCKLTYKNNYMIVKNEDINMIHLSEIDTLILESNKIAITTMLINELLKNKIKIVFCDERHNPSGEVIPYYGCHNTSKKVVEQINISKLIKEEVWNNIIKQKIRNQGNILKKYDKENYENLIIYSNEVVGADLTNREGHSAKIYFKSLFGEDFTRDDISEINSALDYGYSILLSSFNKEVVKNGYITQLGINHRSEFNYFNLSCDLMEPFRPIIDDVVYKNRYEVFDKYYKYKLINCLNEKIKVNNKEYFLSNAIEKYTKNIISVLENEKIEELSSIELL